MFIKIIENGLFGIVTEKLSLTAESIGFWLLMMLAAILSIASGYFLGSLNAAIIISTKKYKTDIRACGSGNAGMTNMFRTFGKTGGFLTLFGDVAKTVLPICLGYLFFGYAGAYISGLFVVMGHCFPVYYRFKGGKGVLAMFAMMLMCDPPVFLLMVLVFAIIAIGTRFVSLASVMTAIFTPLFIDLWYTIMYGDGSTAGFRMPIAFLITVVIVARHYANIKRIMAHEEPRIKMPWEKKNDK